MGQSRLVHKTSWKKCQVSICACRLRVIYEDGEAYLVQGTLTPLTLRPQSCKSDLHVGRGEHLLLIQLSKSRTTIIAHSCAVCRCSISQSNLGSNGGDMLQALTGHTVVGSQGGLASETRRCLLCELHQSSHSRCGNLDRPRVCSVHYNDHISHQSQLFAAVVRCTLRTHIVPLLCSPQGQVRKSSRVVWPTDCRDSTACRWGGYSRARRLDPQISRMLRRLSCL